MTIKDDEQSKPFSILIFMKENVLLSMILPSIILLVFVVYTIIDNKDQKWQKIIDNKPTLRIIRFNQSNLLTNKYTVIKVDGTLNISVPNGEGSSYIYGIDEIEIYEIIK